MEEKWAQFSFLLSKTDKFFLDEKEFIYQKNFGMQNKIVGTNSNLYLINNFWVLLCEFLEQRTFLIKISL